MNAPTPQSSPATSTPKTGVTLEHVLAALGDMDPDKTNAGALRSVIGFGSTTTVQRHLDAIRQERRQREATVAVGEIPPAPREAVDAIWRAAWDGANRGLLTRLAQVTAERDSLASDLAVRTADKEALSEALTRAEEAATEAEQARTLAEERASVLEAEKTAAVEALASAQDQAARDLQTAQEKAALDLQAAQEAGAQERHDLEQRHAIAEREAALRMETMQGLMDRSAQREADLTVQLRDAQRRIDEMLQRIPALAQGTKKSS